MANLGREREQGTEKNTAILALQGNE